MYHVKRTGLYEHPGKTDVYSTPDLQSIILKSASTLGTQNRFPFKSSNITNSSSYNSSSLSNLFTRKNVPSLLFASSNSNISVDKEMVAIGVYVFAKLRLFFTNYLFIFC